MERARELLGIVDQGRTEIADVGWENPDRPGYAQGIPDYLY